MGKSKFFLLLAISLLLFSLSGCGMFPDYFVRIDIEPYGELYDRGFVEIFIDGIPQISKAFEDPKEVMISVYENIPDGIEFNYWEMPDKTRYSSHTINPVIDGRKRIKAVFDVDQGVAVMGNDGKPLYGELLTPQEAFANEANKSIVFMPGEYNGDFDIIVPLKFVETLTGASGTKIHGTVTVKSIGIHSFEGFTLNPDQGEPGLKFTSKLENGKMIIRNNLFQRGEGILFAGEVGEEVEISRNEFLGNKGISFQEKNLSRIDIVNNNFKTNFGVEFLNEISAPVNIVNRNNFQGENEGIYIGGVVLDEVKIDYNIFTQSGLGITIASRLSDDLIITRNLFYEVSSGIVFGQDVEYQSDILIQGNHFEKVSFSGIDFAKYHSASIPSLEIIENNFIDNSNEFGHAIGVHFDDPELIYGFDLDADNDPYIRNNNFQGNDFALGVGDDIWGQNNDAYILDARYNWWGSSSGPFDLGNGDYVPHAEERIKVKPWLTSSY